MGNITDEENSQRKKFGKIYSLPLIDKGTFSFRSSLNRESNLNYSYDYNENWFNESSFHYQHDLVKMSIRVSMASFGYVEGIKRTDNWSSERNIVSLMNKLQFKNIEVHYPAPETNTIGYAIGSKNIVENDGTKYALIMVGIRGGGYYDEWGGNFNIGSTAIHKGFQTAARQVLEGIKNYVSENGGILDDTVKIWISGYSRGAAVTNLTAKQLDEKYLPKVTPENVYAFCFECPANTTNANRSSVLYNNIVNIVNPIDFVPKVPLAGKNWGYGRYGRTFFLPYSEGGRSFTSLFNKMKTEYKRILSYNSILVPYKYIPTTKGQAKKLDLFFSSLAEVLPRKNVVNQDGKGDSVEKILMDSVGGAFSKKNSSAHDDSISRLPVQIDTILNSLLLSKITAPAKALLYGDLSPFNEESRIQDLLLSHYPELCLSWLDILSGKLEIFNSDYGIVYV